MLYVIDKQYYIKVGRKFIQVDVSYDAAKDNLIVKANKKRIIEDNGNIKYSIKNITDEFKKSLKPTSEMRVEMK